MKKSVKRYLQCLGISGWGVLSTVLASGVAPNAEVNAAAEKFSQLGHLLDTPSDTRTASGEPGPGYWQQRADYDIKVTLDEAKNRILGKETILYYNGSPHALRYLWLQLEQNRFRPDSDDVLTTTAPNFKEFPYRSLANALARAEFQGGITLGRITDAQQHALTYTVVKTMLRVELPQPLKPGEKFSLNIEWQHNIPDAVSMRTRGGYEYFKEDNNYIYEISEWYPRLAAYTDYQGWQHKQFLGRGEFTLDFGDFSVEITVPADHIVAATGELQNAKEILTAAQSERLAKARKSDKPVFIVSPDEAKRNQNKKVTATRTWRYKAENVRDFAFASSRKFIWDAMKVESGGRDVMAMSYYSNEAEPLWSRYSSQAIAHTLRAYSRYTFDYPYPVAISVNGPVGGMEYPMISFNAPRPYKDGTYWDSEQDEDDRTWERSKYGLISVIIHEVGHNYFPMVVNSDERQWTWMDEGLNTFLQFLAEQSWQEDYPSRRGEPRRLVEYMLSTDQVPVMTNSESLLQFGNNAYAKPAVALNILRESILGRDLFDYAFREYAMRWKFKRPTPADFFRTMEDASGIDLDWFWRGWFYGTDHVDVSIDKVTLYELDSKNPDIEKARARKIEAARLRTLSEQRNKREPMLVDALPELKDFYNDFDEFSVTPYDYANYKKLLQSLEDRDKVLLAVKRKFYAVDFSNVGGLVTPLPLTITYEDNTQERMVIPAEIWRLNDRQATKLFVSDKAITSIEFDPFLETADTDVSNNQWPRKPEKARFELFKKEEAPNPMLRMSEDLWKQQEN